MPDVPQSPLPTLSPDDALFLDVDGTLLEIALTPESVVVPPRVPVLLERLRQRQGGALALVSGRSLNDLDQLFTMPDLPAAGLHGLERRHADGTLVRPPTPAWIATARIELAAFMAANPGTVFEDKGLSLALHYRLAPAVGPAAVALAASMAAAIGSGAVVQQGKMVVELRPAGIDKGGAILALLATPPFLGRRPVFAGDDVTDEHGFKAVNEAGGVAIRIGSTAPTSAPWRVPSIPDLLDWLESPWAGTF
jgi:trehalose 6-phosphate phosphatase